MRLVGSAILTVGTLAILLTIWRIVSAVEAWLWATGAGNMVMWAAVAALVFALLGVGVGVGLGAVGLGLRAYVVRVPLDERDPVALGRVLRPELPKAKQPQQIAMDGDSVLIEREAVLHER